MRAHLCEIAVSNPQRVTCWHHLVDVARHLEPDGERLGYLLIIPKQRVHWRKILSQVLGIRLKLVFFYRKDNQKSHSKVVTYTTYGHENTYKVNAFFDLLKRVNEREGDSIQRGYQVYPDVSCIRPTSCNKQYKNWETCSKNHLPIRQIRLATYKSVKYNNNYTNTLDVGQKQADLPSTEVDWADGPRPRSVFILLRTQKLFHYHHTKAQPSGYLDLSPRPWNQTCRAWRQWAVCWA